jgi:hypothetical protein
MPSDALIRFYNEFFPDKEVDIDSMEVTYKLIEEINKERRKAEARGED